MNNLWLFGGSVVAGYLGVSLLRLGHHDVYDDSHDPIKVPFSGNYPSRKLQPHYPDYIPYAATTEHPMKCPPGTSVGFDPDKKQWSCCRYKQSLCALRKLFRTMHDKTDTRAY